MPKADGTGESHTGQLFGAPIREDRSRMGEPKPNDVRTQFLPGVLFAQPAMLECESCKSRTFHIFVENGQPFAQFKCATARCRSFWPAMQLMIPQMTDEVERRIARRGSRLVVPRGLSAPLIDEVVDIPNPKRIRSL